MLFALIDYIQYHFHIGFYSPASIKKQGGSLATTENFPNPEKYKTGDFFFLYTPDSLLSWFVLYYTGPTIWSHVGMFFKDGNVCDATTAGIMIHPFSDYLDGESYIGVIAIPDAAKEKETGLREEQRKDMQEFMQSQVGCKFNWSGVFLFWVAIVVGNDNEYRLRYSFDILIFLSMFMMLGIWYRVILLPTTVIGIAYVLTVLFNATRRKFKYEKYRA